jgi:predicted Zn-dependent protease
VVQVVPGAVDVDQLAVLEHLRGFFVGHPRLGRSIRFQDQRRRGYHRSTYARLSTTVRTPDGTSSGWAERPSIRIREIAGAMLGESAIRKCLRWKNPRRLEPGKYTVVLESTAVGDLVGEMDFASRGAEEGRTALSKGGGGTRLGEKLFPEIITLRSDPFGSKLPALPWSAGLIPNRPMTWVDKGVVRNLFYDRYWAAKTNHPPSPWPCSLVLDGSDASLDELIRSVDRGLLVTHFWYMFQVNPKTLQLTGLTRDGLFLIENGKIATSVMNFRFNESPIRMLQNTQRLGRPSRTRGEGGEMIAAPLVATDFTFTSISDAV